MRGCKIPRILHDTKWQRRSVYAPAALTSLIEPQVLKEFEDGWGSDPL